MSVQGLISNCERGGIALIRASTAEVVYAPEHLQIPDALFGALRRADQHLRLKQWNCFKLSFEDLWMAMPPNLNAALDEITFLKQQLNWIEGRDLLSGLLTRSAWHAQPMAIDDSPQLVAFLRIHNLTRIAERQGTRSADIILQTMGGRLLNETPTATAARVSNDAFHWRMKTPADLTQWLIDVHQRLSQPAHLEFGQAALKCVIGVAVAPEHGCNIETLSRHAELAAQSAEDRGFDYLIFDQGIAEAYRRRTIIARSTQDAFSKGQLAVHYQPQIDLAQTGAASAEALIRWTHPELGAVSPNEFLPTFERQGLLGRLTEFVLESAIRDWKALGHEHFRMSINLPPDLVEETFCQAIIDRCKQNQFPLGCLTLEITEQRLTQLEGALMVIKRLQQAGVRIAIDDFGVGESSLSRIGQIQFDELKIDQSLVTWVDIASNQPTVIRSIVSMARALHMEVIAEGVETEQQLEMLRDAGCDRIQGFYHAKPMPLEQLKAFMAPQ